jgi:hypothetical protein
VASPGTQCTHKHIHAYTYVYLLDRYPRRAHTHVHINTYGHATKAYFRRNGGARGRRSSAVFPSALVCLRRFPSILALLQILKGYLRIGKVKVYVMSLCIDTHAWVYDYKHTRLIHARTHIHTYTLHHIAHTTQRTRGAAASCSSTSIPYFSS